MKSFYDLQLDLVEEKPKYPSIIYVLKENNRSRFNSFQKQNPNMPVLSPASHPPLPASTHARSPYLLHTQQERIPRPHPHFPPLRHRSDAAAKYFWPV